MRSSSRNSWNTCTTTATSARISCSNSRRDAIAKAGARGEENLAYLSSLGFTLSLDHVENLALDFAKLKAMGFRHIKIRAGMLTHGMSGANASVAAQDLKKLLERHGLNLIAERVEDEKTVVELLDYNVDFAQGLSLR